MRKLHLVNFVKDTKIRDISSILKCLLFLLKTAGVVLVVQEQLEDKAGFWWSDAAQLFDLLATVLHRAPGGERAMGHGHPPTGLTPAAI